MARMPPQVLGRRLGLANAWGISAVSLTCSKHTWVVLDFLDEGLELPAGGEGVSPVDQQV